MRCHLAAGGVPRRRSGSSGLPVVAVCLLGLVAAGSDADYRYVLCDGAEALPSVALPEGKLSIYAASLAWRLTPMPLLRAALLWEGDGGFVPRLPCANCLSGMPSFQEAVDGMSYPAAQKASRMSREEYDDPPRRAARLSRYAKCIGPLLPKGTQLGCRIGERGGAAPPRWNGSLTEAKLVRFSTGELRHEFAQCTLDGAVFRRWRHSRGGQPERLLADLFVVTPEIGRRLGGFGYGYALPAVRLELCRVREPMLELSFCTMPLYGAQAIEKELPWALEDWLAYHLDFLGFGRGDLYDVDGSFEDVVERRRARGAARGALRYHGRWPNRLSEQLALHSQRHPGCAETFAYAHCLTNHRVFSKFVVILHSPDEYIAVKDHDLRWVTKTAEAQNELNDPAGMFFLSEIHWAKGGAMSVHAPWARGSVLVASHLRDPVLRESFGVFDPNVCICAGPHRCYGDVDGHYRVLAHRLPADLVVVHHYVEMFAREAGACTNFGGEACTLEDPGRSLALPFLEFLSSSPLSP